MQSKINLDEEICGKPIKQVRVLAEEARIKHEVGQRNTIFPKRTGNIVLIVLLFAAAIRILMLPVVQKEGLGSAVTIFFVIFAVRLINAARKK